MKIAVIDIGTNSIHMLMARILPNYSFEVIGREKEMIRLGAGALKSGYLTNERMELGIETLKKFKYLSQSKGVQKILAVATSAVRESHNGGDFLKRVLKVTGIKVRVITGEEEGRLIYQGVKHSVPLPSSNSLIIDIGGGSVELMLVTPQEILYLTSLKIGSARLHECFLKKYREKDFFKMESHIRKQLREVVESISDLGFFQVVGTSGTLNNLAVMASLVRDAGDPGALRNSSLHIKDMEALYDKLKSSTTEQRMEMKGLDPRRGDIILGGAAVALVMMQELRVPKLVICDKAIREGLIYQYIAGHRRQIQSEVEVPDVRRRSVLRLAHKCDYEKAHAEQTARLALQIFDRMQNIHKLTSLDRELLEHAALLHDIGYHISYDRHHLHAYYLVKNVSMNGFSEEEIEMIALVTRYHRRSLPKATHGPYQELPKRVRKRVRWLAAILKIADALDRSHFTVVENVRLRIYDHKIIFHVETSHDVEYEIWEAEQRCELLKRLCKRHVEFKPKLLPKQKCVKGKVKDPKVKALRVLS